MKHGIWAVSLLIFAAIVMGCATSPERKGQRLFAGCRDKVDDQASLRTGLFVCEGDREAEPFGGNGRACVLRFYWDGEETPSVEVPMTDFFAVGHDLYAPVNSLAVIVNPQSALNCFWSMPSPASAE